MYPESRVNHNPYGRHALGGNDLVSANVYRTQDADCLRACEMPDAKVLAFLRGWSPG